MKYIKTTLILAAITCGQSLVAQNHLNYKVISQYVNDMFFDSINTQQIILTIPSSDLFHGNSIGFFDPHNMNLTNYYFIGSEPNQLSNTSTGKYAYLNLNGSKNVKKFNLLTRASEQTISMGFHISALDARSICVSPDNDSILAVARGRGDTYAHSVVLFNNGVMLKDSVNSSQSRVDVIRYYKQGILFGYNNLSSGFQFTTMKTDSMGVKYVNSVSSVFNDFDIEFYINNDWAVSDNGFIVDLSVSPPSSVGKFNLLTIWGPGKIKACYDRYQDLWCFVSKGFWTDTLYIQRFHANNLLLKDVLRVGIIKEDVNKMICWGDSTKLMISTKGGKLIATNGFIPDSITGTNEYQKPDIFLYPNPVTRRIYINSLKPLRIVVKDLVGREMISTIDKNELDLSELPKSIYIVSVSDLEGNLIKTQRILKQ